MPYEAVPGTVPYRAIAHLRTLKGGAELTMSELAIALGMENAKGLKSWLMPAVQFGSLSMRTVEAPRRTLVSLGDGREMFDREHESRATTVSATAVSSVFAYAETRNAAPFSTAISSDGRLTIERNGRVIAELTPEEAKMHKGFLKRQPEWEMQE